VAGVAKPAERTGRGLGAEHDHKDPCRRHLRTRYVGDSDLAAAADADRHRVSTTPTPTACWTPVRRDWAGWQVYDDVNNNGQLDAGEPVTTHRRLRQLRPDAAGRRQLRSPRGRANTVSSKPRPPPASTQAPSPSGRRSPISTSATPRRSSSRARSSTTSTATASATPASRSCRAGRSSTISTATFSSTTGSRLPPPDVTAPTGSWLRTPAATPSSKSSRATGHSSSPPPAPTPARQRRDDVTVSGLDFGNYEAATVSGIVFDDVNGKRRFRTQVICPWPASPSTSTPTTTANSTPANNRSSPTPPALTASRCRCRVRTTSVCSCRRGASSPHPRAGRFSGTPTSGRTDHGPGLSPRFQTLTLSGTVFTTLNGNGVRDAGEPGLRSNTVKLLNAATGAVGRHGRHVRRGQLHLHRRRAGNLQGRGTARTGFTITTAAPAALTSSPRRACGDVAGGCSVTLARAIIAVREVRAACRSVYVYKASTGQLHSAIMAYDPSFRGGVPRRGRRRQRRRRSGHHHGAGPGGVSARSGRRRPHRAADRAVLRLRADLHRGVWGGGRRFSTATAGPTFSTGAGAGGGPKVKVFTSAMVRSWPAFRLRPNFTGGVTVAAADVDRDGRADITAGAGPVAVRSSRCFRDREPWP